MHRLGVQLLAVGQLHDLPQIHNRDAVADVLDHPQIHGGVFEMRKTLIVPVSLSIAGAKTESTKLLGDLS